MSVEGGIPCGIAIRGNRTRRNHPFGVETGREAVARQNLGSPFAGKLSHWPDLQSLETVAMLKSGGIHLTSLEERNAAHCTHL